MGTIEKEKREKYNINKNCKGENEQDEEESSKTHRQCLIMRMKDEEKLETSH